jgi:hypothetical protein
VLGGVSGDLFCSRSRERHQLPPPVPREWYRAAGMPRGHQKGQHCKWRESLDRSRSCGAGRSFCGATATEGLWASVGSMSIPFVLLAIDSMADTPVIRHTAFDRRCALDILCCEFRPTSRTIFGQDKHSPQSNPTRVWAKSRMH